jgi:hypothetical protein
MRPEPYIYDNSNGIGVFEEFPACILYVEELGKCTIQIHLIGLDLEIVKKGITMEVAENLLTRAYRGDSFRGQWQARNVVSRLSAGSPRAHIVFQGGLRLC